VKVLCRDRCRRCPPDPAQRRTYGQKQSILPSDSYLRFFVAFTVDKPHAFATEVLRGAPRARSWLTRRRPLACGRTLGSHPALYIKTANPAFAGFGNLAERAGLRRTSLCGALRARGARAMGASLRPSSSPICRSRVRTPLRVQTKKGASRPLFWIWRRERDSNPRYGLTRIHAFQACSFNHSDTSP
jgi:hypothetical protein